MESLNNILYIDEHRSCTNYFFSTHGTGFRYTLIKAGEVFSSEEQSLNYLFCILSGSVSIRNQDFPERILRGGEMVLITRGNSLTCTVIEALELLVFGFDVPKSSCDKMIFENFSPLADSIEYDFSPTPIKEPLKCMLDLLVVCLQSGMNCIHLHELKHREFFLFIRAFYSRQEIAHLFHPLLGKSLDFRNTILQNYRKASNISALISFTNLSRSSFFVHFKQEFGMTAKEWLAQRIKQDIIRLASDRRLSTKEIMHDLNFDSPQQFNRFCRNNFGLPPSQLIGQIREEMNLIQQPS